MPTKSWHEYRMSFPMTKPGEKTPSSLLPFRPRSRAEILDRINRITGLKFERVPDSLVKEPGGLPLPQDDGEELVHRALALWTDDENSEQ